MSKRSIDELKETRIKYIGAIEVLEGESDYMDYQEIIELLGTTLSNIESAIITLEEREV